MNLREWVDKTMNEKAQKYYEIVFLQGENAEEPLKILDDKGEEIGGIFFRGCFDFFLYASSAGIKRHGRTESYGG